MKKLKTEMMVGLGIGLLGIASVLLNNKKDDLAKEAFKKEVLEDVMKEINKEE